MCGSFLGHDLGQSDETVLGGNVRSLEERHVLECTDPI